MLDSCKSSEDLLVETVLAVELGNEPSTSLYLSVKTARMTPPPFLFPFLFLSLYSLSVAGSDLPMLAERPQIKGAGGGNKCNVEPAPWTGPWTWFFYLKCQYFSHASIQHETHWNQCCWTVGFFLDVKSNRATLHRKAVDSQFEVILCANQSFGYCGKNSAGPGVGLRFCHGSYCSNIEQTSFTPAFLSVPLSVSLVKVSKLTGAYFLPQSTYI